MWTRSSIARELIALRGSAWRATENLDAMARLLTTDPFDAPGLLLDLIGDGERNYPAECRHLHPLLKAPFERRESDPPMSRFRRRRADHRALYLAEHRQTALAEFSYYQFVFFCASDGHAWPSRPRMITVFQAHYATVRGIDLIAPPFAVDRADWTNVESYDTTQAFGDAAAAVSAEIIRFESVRDSQRRANLAVLSCAGIDAPMPTQMQAWAANVEPERVTLHATLPGAPGTTVFERAAFEVDGRLPRPRANGQG